MSAQLVPGISRLSRSQSYAKRALFSKQKVAAKKQDKTVVQKKTVQVKGPKNGKTRVVDVIKAPKFYPADDILRKKVTRKSPKPASLRTSITPGTVLILLAGRFRGKRVVFLKQLSSGLLLVSGPHKINGVPLRRVNQAYVIATSTKVDVSKVKIDEKFDDSYFKVAKEAKKSEVDPARVADQKAVDLQLLAAIKKVPTLKAYLNASFSLSKNEFPHNLKF